MRRWWRKYRDFIEFLGLTVVGPCVIYALIFHSLTPHTDGESLVAGALALAGAFVWVARNH